MRINRGRWVGARAVLAAVLAAGVLGMAGEAGAQTAAACRGEARGAQAAAAMAQACETEVEILDQRTATGTYFAEPDGTTTVRLSSGSNWTTVRSCSPNTSYWTTRRDAIRVGNEPDQPSCINRAFVNIPLDGLAGATINYASFFSNMDHTAPCASPTPEVRLAVTTQTWIRPGVAVTWNNTSDYFAYRAWVVGSASPSSANETGTCGRDMGDKLVQWGVPAGDVQWFTNQAYPTLTFQLYSTIENSWTTWKKFYPDSSYLEINFSTPPESAE